jgi:dipeptidase E
VSAGASCWFEGSASDAFGIGTIAPLADGLGLLPGSFCPHYDRQPNRRTAYERMVVDGNLPPGIACDDFAAVHFLGNEVVDVVATRKGAGATRVTPGAEGAHHEPIPARPLV